MVLASDRVDLRRWLPKSADMMELKLLLTKGPLTYVWTTRRKILRTADTDCSLSLDGEKL